MLRYFFRFLYDVVVVQFLIYFCEGGGLFRLVYLLRELLLSQSTVYFFLDCHWFSWINKDINEMK